MIKPNGPYALAIQVNTLEEINRGLEARNNSLRRRLADFEGQVRSLNRLCERQAETICHLTLQLDEAQARISRLDVGLGARAPSRELDER